MSTPQQSADRSSLHTFNRLLGNTLLSGVTSSFLWFALTFWVFLETGSVVATGVIGGSFGIATAVLAPWFGTYVDHHRKHAAMVLATSASLGCFVAATAVFYAIPASDLLQLRNPWFFVLVAATLFGSVAGQARSIAMATCVSVLVPEDQRDRANGKVGTVTGASFAITSVFSGLVIGRLGMGAALVISMALTATALAHLATIQIGEDAPAAADPTSGASHVDVRGALEAVSAVPGLMLLLLLAAFNNLLGGVFMALMDAYGLSLVSVETWGVLWGFISLSFIAGGLLVARRGLGRNPLRLILVLNLVNWTVSGMFALQASIVMLTIAMIVWLGTIPIIEAAEQTVLQRAVPFERQGRVFGFAQLVENAASPLTAFLMAPLAEVVFVPFMTDGRGADWIGGWFGTGPERGIGLMFVLAGMVGVVITLAAYGSRSYRALSASWSRSPSPASDPVAA